MTEAPFNKMNPATWATLSAYAQTLEGAALPQLAQRLKPHAPMTRLQGPARVTAQALGTLTADGTLTPLGLEAARAAAHRHGLTAGADLLTAARCEYEEISEAAASLQATLDSQRGELQATGEYDGLQAQADRLEARGGELWAYLQKN